MNAQDAKHLFTMINAIWKQRQIEGPDEAILVPLLVDIDFNDAAKAVAKMADTEVWFSIATLKKLTRARSSNALPAPADVFKQIRGALLTHPDLRDAQCGDALKAVVKHLGGWASVGALSLEGADRPFVLKRIEEAIAEADLVDGVPFTRLSLSTNVPITRQIMAEEGLKALPAGDE